MTDISSYYYCLFLNLHISTLYIFFDIKVNREGSMAGFCDGNCWNFRFRRIFLDKELIKVDSLLQLPNPFSVSSHLKYTLAWKIAEEALFSINTYYLSCVLVEVSTYPIKLLEFKSVLQG